MREAERFALQVQDRILERAAAALRRLTEQAQESVDPTERLGCRSSCSESPARCSKRSGCVRWWALDFRLDFGNRVAGAE